SGLRRAIRSIAVAKARVDVAQCSEERHLCCRLRREGAGLDHAAVEQIDDADLLARNLLTLATHEETQHELLQAIAASRLRECFVARRRQPHGVKADERRDRQDYPGSDGQRPAM